jgi:hemerythrin
METFQWNRQFETGLESVDQQHHSLVDLINRFSTSLGEGVAVDPEELERVYGELASYAKSHFQDEQQLMEQEGVDARHQEAHAKEHDSFLLDVTRIHLGAGKNLVAEARPLLNFLTHWLAYHILGMDLAMAHQIAAIRAGTTPAVAYFAGETGDDAARSPLLGALTGLFELVSERNRQLFEMNQSLESKVLERTQALSEANRALLQTIEHLKAEQEQTLRLSEALASTNVRLETMAMTDSLTGLFNRRYAMERLASELSAATRHGAPLTLALIDADGFKAINDTYGHDAGDAVIRSLGTSLKQLFRTDDVVCRMGGDEFLAICPHTGSEGGYQVAERVRSAIAAMRIPAGEGEWKGSLSIGVATLGQGLEDLETLIKAADTAVYKAKHHGRNRVETYRSPGFPS